MKSTSCAPLQTSPPTQSTPQRSDLHSQLACCGCVCLKDSVLGTVLSVAPVLLTDHRGVGSMGGVYVMSVCVFVRAEQRLAVAGAFLCGIHLINSNSCSVRRHIESRPIMSGMGLDSPRCRPLVEGYYRDAQTKNSQETWAISLIHGL